MGVMLGDGGAQEVHSRWPAWDMEYFSVQNLWVLQDFVIGVRVVYDGDWGAQVPSNGSKQDGSTHWRPPGEK